MANTELKLGEGGGMSVLPRAQLQFDDFIVWEEELANFQKVFIQTFIPTKINIRA